MKYSNYKKKELIEELNLKDKNYKNQANHNKIQYFRLIKVYDYLKEKGLSNEEINEIFKLDSERI